MIPKIFQKRIRNKVLYMYIYILEFEKKIVNKLPIHFHISAIFLFSNF